MAEVVVKHQRLIMVGVENIDAVLEANQNALTELESSLPLLGAIIVGYKIPDLYTVELVAPDTTEELVLEQFAKLGFQTM